MDSNAEAGPSRPRPATSTPPATPTTPAKAKRRSWFGFASPVTPLSKEKDQERRRNSVMAAEELELGPVTGGSTGSSGGSVFSAALKGDKAAQEEELLTIDGDLESTVKKKKKKKRRSGGIEEDEMPAMRMDDLGLKAAPSRSVSDKTLTPGDTMETPHAFTSRTFSRTASDRLPPPLAEPLPPLTTDFGPSMTLAHPPPRTSSLRSQPSPTIPFHFDKSQPALPVDTDRPLPPLPPDPGPHTGDTLAVPRVPSGIVVTPSSPRKLQAPVRRQQQEADRRGRSLSGRPRSNSRGRRTHSTEPSKSIGLGLPSALLPSGRSRSQSRTRTSTPSSSSIRSSSPPPVPSKPQSVSSPLPSRAPSPSPRIAFAEPDVPAETRRPDEGRRGKVKRARSLSGLFGKPPQIAPAKAGGDGVPTPESVDSPGEAENVSAGGGKGVLEWLGVRKTVKRRPSESNFKNENEARASGGVPGAGAGERGEGMGSAEHLQDRERQVSQESVDRAVDLNDSGDLVPPHRPDMTTASSTVTVVPNSTPGKLASLFTRRASSKNAEEEADHPTISVAPRSMPTPSSLRGPPSSSQSSFVLPAVDPISPFVPEQSGAWMSSPGTEGEEILFSPGGSSHWGPGVRPWMDATEQHNSSRTSVSSTLDALPEQVVETGQVLTVPQEVAGGPVKSPASMREGRIRSWSDAPLPQHRMGPGPGASPSDPNSPGIAPGSISLQPSPQTPQRPKLGSRSNSGNSAIIGRMKSVFSKSTSRGRSNSLLRQASSDVDEFGAVVGEAGQGQGQGQRMRPSTSSSSMSSGPARAKSMIGDEALLGLHHDERPAGAGRPSRSSLTPSSSSFASSSRQQTVPDPAHDLHALPSKPVTRNRARASTIGLTPSSYHFAPPPTASPFPIAATPPRRRPSIRHRISNNLFGGSGPSSPQNSLFPLPPRSSGSTTSLAMPGSVSGWEDGSAGMLSPGTSPRPSTGSLTVPKSVAMKQAAVREGEETPRQWLERVVNTVGRDEIANVLASSGDEFHIKALQLYLGTFDFTHNALDVALRRMLMHMSLPRETQQIDRVIEAFAKQYEQCEPGLFGQKDHTYVLAFSMMMLHTDAFNKHNKNKMTKADYVRNTRMEGVPPFVLEAFFDNITFTPFVFIEDDSDLKRSSGYQSTPSTFGPTTPTFSGPLNAPNPPPKSTKVDVYDLIVRGLLGSLRVNVEKLIPAESPFSCMGTRPFLDLEGLNAAFAGANSLLIPTPQPAKKVPGKLVTPAKRVPGGESAEAEMTLRVTKVGLISRKDEGGSDNKKASKKWKSWSVILTGSQLLFFKDPTWALTLLEQARSSAKSDQNGHLLFPRITTFKPDEVFPVKDCIAVYDRTFTDYPNTFRFFMPHNDRQYLMQAPDEYDMNEWISLINYASAFKTAGIKMRSGAMRKDQAVLAGAAAAASHRRELRGGDSQSSLPAASATNGTVGGKKAFGDPGLGGELKTAGGGGDVRGVDVDGANERLHEGEQLEEVFGVVKAELAAGRGGAQTSHVNGAQAERASGQTPRVAIIQKHLGMLQQKCTPLEQTVMSSLLLARNIAILTPFQKSTRDRLSQHLPSLADRIRSSRIQLAKIRLWMTVLEHEAEREEREWKVVRHVALQAAARSLREDGVRGVVEDVVKDGEDRPVPTLELPDEEAAEGEVRFGTSPGELPVMFRRGSDEPDGGERGGHTMSRETTMSLGASLPYPDDERRRRTLSSSEYWLSPAEQERRSSDAEDASAPSSRMGTPDMTINGHGQTVGARDSGTSTANGSRRGSATGYHSSGRETPMFAMESPMDIGDEDRKREPPLRVQVPGDDKEFSRKATMGDEEAEEWQNTKAAKRVSLVRPGEMGDWESMRKISAGSRKEKETA
ncbi:hypothetical protein IAT38_008118 [Cryptococcus sp. DSM 104549]